MAATTEAGAFGAGVHNDLASTLERIASEARHGDFSEAMDLLRHARSRLEALNPGDLEPRGWFDSRSKRLKRFRAAFQDCADALTHAATELDDRAQRMLRRVDSLETLGGQARAQIIDLDAHVEAARTAPRAAPEGLSAAVDDLSRAVAEEEAGGTDSWDNRASALMSVRDAGVRQLPVLRSAQNIAAATPAAVKAACASVSTWRSEWTGALGLAGRRPRKVKPDLTVLRRTQGALVSDIDRATAALEQARARNADVEHRLDTAAKAARAS